VTFELRIRHSRRARRARIVVAPFGPVEVVVPAGTSRRWAERFAGEHRGWIERRLERFAEIPRLGLDRPDVAWIGGRTVPRPHTDLERWYRAHARAAVTAALERESDRLGIEGWRRVRIGDPRTRWGSCSTSGTLSFSWRLVMAPPEVLGYVVVHELCHLRHLDHSRAFWSLVADACPDHRSSQAWLRRHGAELLAYEPTASSRSARSSQSRYR
jgi:predicted metal-dependent hydrolase